MDVTLLAETHRYWGEQRLTYTNRSPDTLRQAFYHLYFNAFQPGSMMAERNRHLPDPDGRVVPRIFELGPEEIGYLRPLRLTQDGAPVEWRVTDTVLQVDLAEPILPGATVTFEMAFEGQVPLQTRRSGRDNREGVEFSMTQWYPKLAHYDGTGWHADPYIGREFYGEFGTFDVRLTLPSAYVVGATGVLQNPEAVGHGYDRPPRPLDVETEEDAGPAADGAAGSPPPDSLTWHFRAERVHDFAWAADPDFVHERHLVEDVPGRAEPVALHLLYQPDVAPLWEPLAEWTAEMVRFFSAEYGPYPYPQFTVVHGGDGGMEYPMITLITGRRGPQSLFGVTAHELAHMWFYGMLGTNEADFAWMDEGMTGFADTEAAHHLLREADGPADHAAAVRSVAAAQNLGYYEPPNTPADWFGTNAAYGVGSYRAGEALLSLLGYVAGDEARDEVLRRYAQEWRFRHPTPADFEAVAERVSGLQLDWLFEQFLDAGARYDYAADDLNTERTATGYRSTVTLRRDAAGVLPAEVRVTFEDGSERWVSIPLATMFGHKPVPEGWAVAEPWPWVAPIYRLALDAPSPAVEAVVDPRGRTPDGDRADNRVARGLDVPLAFEGWFRQPEVQQTARAFALAPIALYADGYGFGAGLQLRAVSAATYAAPKHTLQLGVTLWPHVLASGVTTEFEESPLVPFAEGGPEDRLFDPLETSAFDGIDYTLRATRRLGRHSLLGLDAEKHLGILENRLSGTHALGGRTVFERPHGSVTLSLIHQHRASDAAFPYLAERDEVFGARAFFGEDHMLSARLDLDLGDRDDGLSATVELGAGLEPFSRLEGTPSRPGAGPRFAPTRSANRAYVTASKGLPLGPFTLRARTAVGFGDEWLTPQKRFRLGGATVETRWREAAFRVPAAALDDPRGDAHLVAFSGFGPVGYLLDVERPRLELPDPICDGRICNPVLPLPPRREGTVLGNGLLAGTLALELAVPEVAGADDVFNDLLAPLRLEVFTGAGAAWNTDRGLGADDWLADAGLGVRYDLGAFEPLERFTGQSDVLSGLRLAAKLPLWLSDPERAGDDDEFKFRWLIGVEAGL